MVSAGERDKAARRGRRHSARKVTSEQRPRGSKPEHTTPERLFQSGATALRWAEVGSVKSEEWQGGWSEGRGKRGGQ